MSNIEVITKCKHLLPCGRCDLNGGLCDEGEGVQVATIQPCKHEWIVTKRVEFPKRYTVERWTYYQCIKCGETKAETKNFTYENYAEDNHENAY